MENVSSFVTKVTNLTVSLTPAPSSNGLSLPSDFNINDFFYPKAVLVGNLNGNYLLKTDDSMENVIGWYKNKIPSSKMNVKTLIQTNTNGNIINQLVGSGPEGELRIEMSKESSQPEIQILVTFNKKGSK
ncbi:MAG: hypothetical protein M1514_01840 [Patescibacteria group bacterium]|nr:hypothetical protein [Patescibacteria group bacterium]